MIARGTVRHPTLVDQLVEHIYSRVIGRELQAGQRITEEQLAVDFGVSRTPVREAVKRLVEMGVVVVYPRARLEISPVEPEEICQINQLREDLECLALTYAMPRMSEEDIDRLEGLALRCRQMAQTGNRIETFKADSAFHLAIATLSGNRYLLEALGRLDVKVQLCREAMCLSKKKIRDSVEFHLRITKAIRQRSVEQACELLRQHIRGTLQQTKGNRDE